CERLRSQARGFRPVRGRGQGTRSLLGRHQRGAASGLPACWPRLNQRCPMPSERARVENPLRILHVEDDPADAELIRETLEAAGLPCPGARGVETRDEFARALAAEPFDLILADYRLPAFDGLSALAIARQQKPDVPFILVSGTMGEDAAVDSLKA